VRRAFLTAKVGYVTQATPAKAEEAEGGVRAQDPVCPGDSLPARRLRRLRCLSAFYPEPEPPDYPPGPEFVGPEPIEEEKRLMAEPREEEEAFR
jgi:hypothetical protein